MKISGLYINNKKCDFDDYEKISWNFYNSSSHSPEAIRNSFSKSVELKGTKTNNQIFSELWGYDRVITDTSFNPNKRVPFQIFRNSELLESGYCQLDHLTTNGELITYSLTLYGMLGDFFFNLKGEDNYNLSNLYYGFLKWDEEKKEWVKYKKEEENSLPLLNWNMTYIFDSWTKLKNISPDQPLNINNYITAAPTYQGFYDDFSSDVVLINHGYHQLPPEKRPPYITEEWVNAMNSIYPFSIEKDGKPYSTKKDWSKVKLPREFNQWEVGELRSHYQRPAIRTKLVLDAINNPDNNGGFNVHWDIPKNDPIWDYYNNSFIIRAPFELDKFNGEYATASFPETSGISLYDPETGTYLTNTTQISSDYFEQHGIDTAEVPAFFNLDLEARFNVDTPIKNPAYSTFAYSSIGGEMYRLTLYVFSLDEYDVTQPGVLLSSKEYAYAAVHPSNTSSYYRYIFQLGFDELVKPKYPNIESFKFTKFEVKQTPEKQTFAQFEDKINLQLPLKSGKKPKIELKVREIDVYFQAFKDKAEPSGFRIQPALNPVKPRKGQIVTGSDTGKGTGLYFTLQLFATEQPTINWGGTGSQFSTAVTKSVLFGETKTPFDYLTSFTKMFNLRYSVDPYSKTIIIQKREKYYNIDGGLVDLTDKIDMGREIKVTPYTTETSNYQLKLESDEEIYGQYLYHKKHSVDIGEKIYTTPFEFNSEYKNLFDSLIYTTAPDYVHNSPYYNHSKAIIEHNTIPAPSINLVPSYEHTLYSSNIADASTTDTLFGVQSFGSVFSTPDPAGSKLCFFDKEYKQITQDNTFTMFNGFVELERKDWVYLSDNQPIMQELNDGPCFSIVLIDKQLWPINEKTIWGYRSTEDADGANIAYICDSLPMFTNCPNSKNSTLISQPDTYFIDTTDQKYIFNQYWESYLDDIYSPQSRILECWVNIGNNPQSALRGFYWWKNCIWALEEIQDYTYNFGYHDTHQSKFFKCKFIKVTSKNNYR